MNKKTIVFKFRLWDKENKKMIYNGGFLFDCFDTKMVDCKFICLNTFLESLYEKFDMMLFTGKLDKNNKEIFQEDIVLLGKDKGIVKWDEEECGFVVGQYRSDDDKFNTRFYLFGERKFEWEDLEIIGNIYENPDELKT